MKLTILLLFLVTLLLYLPTRSRALGRWEALSQLESGDNDYAIGRAGEVSRYQISPRNWAIYSAHMESPTYEPDAYDVASRIMFHREAVFVHRHGRRPTNFEWYILWNAPTEVDNPSPIVAGRAIRFANLCSR